jgi:hypothetical protein
MDATMCPREAEIQRITDMRLHLQICENEKAGLSRGFTAQS